MRCKYWVLQENQKAWCQRYGLYENGWNKCSCGGELSLCVCEEDRLNNIELAICGGEKTRKTPLPYRKLFGEEELESVKRVFEDSWNNGVDFGYQGKYEDIYTNKFCEFQGGGCADAVSSGTVAVYIALKIFNLEPKSDVIVSPATTPGSVMPVSFQGMNIIVADSKPNNFNIGPDEFEKALTPNTRAAVLTHLGGHPIDIEPIIEIAKSKNIRIIEDCSQAHGALYKEKRVGCFGDVAAFSTMFSKAHSTGGCGGIVYTKNKDLYQEIRSVADRGKPFYLPDFNPKNAREYLFPTLNFNLDELSCAIGISTLSRLQETINKRYTIGEKINKALESSSIVKGIPFSDYTFPSLFFHTVMVDVDKLKITKIEFAEAIRAEGIWINSDYQCILSEWKWIKGANTPNAINFRNKTFNILFNERFSDTDIQDIIKSILKVENKCKIK